MAKPAELRHRAPKTFRARFISLFLLWRLKTPRHGYSLIRDVEALGIAPMRSSSLYAMLSRLEKGGMIRGEYARDGRMRKMYKTTPKGIALLQHVRREHVKNLLKEFVRDLMG